MGKDDFLTPKAIAKRIKAKGLQKLRWYCQMCQKQCRDQNGFKCHCESESHQRQMALFANNSGRFMDNYSKTFEKDFVYLLKRRWPRTRVHANLVYNEFISDRDHTHMNSTTWETLTSFIKYLGRTGQAVVEDTPKGWYITYKDPEAIAEKEKLMKKAKLDLDDEERNIKYIEKQIEIAKKHEDETKPNMTAIVEMEETTPEQKPVPEQTKTNTQEDGLSKIAFNFGGGSKIKPKTPLTGLITPLDDSDDRIKNHKGPKKTALDAIMEAEEQKKEKFNRKDYWLHPGIIVKILNSKLGDGKYYKKKGVVRNVIDLYIAEIKMIEFPDVLRLDQSQLETVIPSIGGKVRVVNGAYRGQTAALVSIDINNFEATLRIDTGLQYGRLLTAVPYEDFSKIEEGITN
eukprot:TRINITY_DN478_c0_g1_i1.p1 TRINITY_DN478_c0_g1~~TRINITY_DN478_c0_g1_i1.p1  ORF type:complete len:402 (-),score=79.53 TRINITY_DN478_c0_g1_i1:31-1236(-)